MINIQMHGVLSVSSSLDESGPANIWSIFIEQEGGQITSMSFVGLNIKGDDGPHDQWETSGAA